MEDGELGLGLPAEVFFLIIQRLEPGSWGLCSQVCKAWRALILHRLESLTTFIVDPLEVQLASPSSLFLFSQMTNLKHIELEVPSVTDSHLQVIGDCLARLERLSLHLQAEDAIHDQLTNEGYSHLQKLDHLALLNLGFRREVNDKTMVQLRDLAQLRNLNLEGSKVTTEGLRQLSCLSSLSELRLLHSNLIDLTELINECLDLTLLDCPTFSDIDKGMRTLKNLVKLESFAFMMEELRDIHTIHLMSLSSLKYLALNGLYVTDTTLSYITELPKLMELCLPYSTSFTDAGISLLSKLNNLECLILPHCGSKLTGSFATRLCHSTKLKYLYLGDSTWVTEEAAELLFQMKHLNTLNISNTPLSTKLQGLDPSTLSPTLQWVVKLGDH